MTEYQWRSVVRTFWVIAAIVAVVLLWLVMSSAINSSERKAQDTVCDLYESNGLYDEDCS